MPRRILSGSVVFARNFYNRVTDCVKRAKGYRGNESGVSRIAGVGRRKVIVKKDRKIENFPSHGIRNIYFVM